jgi:hypothetical protein
LIKVTQELLIGIDDGRENFARVIPVSTCNESLRMSPVELGLPVAVKPAMTVATGSREFLKVGN